MASQFHALRPRGSDMRRTLGSLWQRLALAATSGYQYAISFGEDAAHSARSAPTDADQFEAFFRRYEPAISSYLWRFTGNEQTAYDLSQETFLRAWQHFARVRAHPHPNRWLFRVATSLAQQHARHGHVVGYAAPLDDDLPSPARDLATQLVESDLVHQTLLLLPANQRALLLLRGVYGFSCEEAARVLGVSAGAAKKMLYRARLLFRQHYLRKDGLP